jgi:hypothetical protein
LNTSGGLRCEETANALAPRGFSSSSFSTVSLMVG